MQEGSGGDHERGGWGRRGRFSNGWKKGCGFFQWLEKMREFFQRLEKNGGGGKLACGGGGRGVCWWGLSVREEVGRGDGRRGIGAGGS